MASQRQFQCKQCLGIATLPADTDPHSVSWCPCCTQDHHHGEGVMAAEECTAANHPGQPCWHPPTQPDKPDGCTVCRPIIHLAVAGSPA